MPSAASRKLASGWLWLGIASVGAGLFAILLVLSRTPYVQDIFPWLIFSIPRWWCMWICRHCCGSGVSAGVLWSLNSSARFVGIGWLALVLASVGAAIIVLSPFVAVGKPLMSNYVPVIESTFFFTGLIVFAIGVAVLVLRSLIAVPSADLWRGGEGSIRIGFYAASISTVFALIAFGWSYNIIPQGIFESTQYYDLLFWGGGHVLQFTYSLLMLAGWLWLADACGAKTPLTTRLASAFLVLGLLPVFYVPVIYLSFAGDMGVYMEQFTQLMKVGGAFAPVPLGLAVLYAIGAAGSTRRPSRNVRRCFHQSFCCRRRRDKSDDRGQQYDHHRSLSRHRRGNQPGLHGIDYPSAAAPRLS